ncbi:MAG: hypothetical protein V5A68_08465, partial [Candidatus Thermoplasmatota archaeon]
MKKKVITILLITVFFVAIFNPVVFGQIQKTNSNHTYGNSSETAKIVTQVKGLNGVDKTSSRMRVENVEKITENLSKLNTAIKKGEEKEALSLAYDLKKQGVFKTDKIFDLIKNRDKTRKNISEKLADKIPSMKDSNASNFLCFVSSYSDEAFFGYPLDAVFISLGILLLKIFDNLNIFT